MVRLAIALFFLTASLGSAQLNMALPFESSAPAPKDKAATEKHDEKAHDVKQAKHVPGTGAADIAVAAPIKSAVETLNDNMWQELRNQQHQDVIAAFAVVFGVAGLVDGRGFFKVIVLACFAAIAFCITLGQLETTTLGKNFLAKYFVSIEAALLTGFVAHKGWEGAQLILGAVLGLYLFHNEQGLASLVPQLQQHVDQSAFIVPVGTICVALGVWAVHDRRGGAKVLGVLASLFGASLVVATLGYLSVFACTFPSIGDAVGVSFKPSEVPCIFEFWNMVAFPLNSKSVGFFTAIHKELVIGKHTFSCDRILSIAAWAVLFIIGSRFQLKRARAEKTAISDMLKARLLPQNEGLKLQNKV